MIEPYEEDRDAECAECHESVMVRDGNEWVHDQSVCDLCAQELLSKREDRIQELEAECERLRTKLLSPEHPALQLALEERRQLEAQCAAMREALLFFKEAERDDGPCWCGYEQEHISRAGPDMGCVKARAALATDSGKALLERLRRAEDLADGDLVHARLAQMHERAEKAEAEAERHKREVVEMATRVYDEMHAMERTLVERAEKAELRIDALKRALEDAISEIWSLSNDFADVLGHAEDINETWARNVNARSDTAYKAALAVLKGAGP